MITLLFVCLKDEVCYREEECRKAGLLEFKTARMTECLKSNQKDGSRYDAPYIMPGKQVVCVSAFLKERLHH